MPSYLPISNDERAQETYCGDQSSGFETRDIFSAEINESCTLFDAPKVAKKLQLAQFWGRDGLCISSGRH